MKNSRSFHKKQIMLDDSFQLHNKKSLQKQVLGTDIFSYQKSSKEYWDFQLSHLNHKLRQKGYLGIKKEWDQGLPQFLNNIIHKWSYWRQQLKEEIQIFAQINMLRIYQMGFYQQDVESRRSKMKRGVNLYSLIYPQIEPLIECLRIKLNLPTIQNQIEQFLINKEFTAENVLLFLKKQMNKLQIKQTKTDRLLLHFINKQHVKKPRPIGAQETKTLKQIINETPQFSTGTSVWLDLFISISTSLQSSAFLSKQYQLRKKLFLNIENQRLPINSCLGCSQFFFYGLNIIDQSTFHAPVAVFPSVHKLKEVELELKDTICGMLNSGGGVILFDCEREYRGIVPKGDIMVQNDKNDEQNRIKSYLQRFHPKPEYGSEVVVSFVPLIDLERPNDSQRQLYSGKEAVLKANSTFIQHRYVDNFYVTRVKVRPMDPTKVYFWQFDNYKEEKRKYSLLMHSNGTLSYLSTRGITKLIKRKMKQFNILQDLDNESKRLLGYPASFFTHQCNEPDSGIVSGTRGNLQNPRKQQKNLPQLCLLVSLKRKFSQVQLNLTRRGFNCQVKLCFQSYKFKIAFTTRILFHDSDFLTLKTQIQKCDQLAGTQSFLIDITLYVKVPFYNRSLPLPQKTFQSFYSIFCKEFPKEQLQAYQSQFQGGCLYLKTQSKMSAVFMYLYLRDIKQLKETVRLENPENLDKMKRKEKDNGLILKFSMGRQNGKEKS